MEYNLPPYGNDLPSYQKELPKTDPEKTGAGLPPANPVINLVLFILTVLTTLFAGSYLNQGDPLSRIEDLSLGIPFSFTLLAIIGCHEFGHYFMCRKHNVAATLPYFLPAPPPFLIGTFGAVIKIRAPIKNNRALFDIGAAGPIAGIIVAIPAIIIGLERSEILEAQPMIGGSLGEPILFKIISRMVLGEIPEGFDVYLHPVAFAGWIGLIVTALNLLPIGQLDGGHIAYALIGKHQAILGYVVFYTLFLLALFWLGWLMFIIISIFIKIRHPAGGTIIEPLDFRRKALGVVCLVLLIVSFIPVPFKGMGLLQMGMSLF